MTVEKFQEVLLAFAYDEIVPNLPPMQISVMGFPLTIGASAVRFAANTAATLGTFSLEKYIPKLTELGLVKDGQIDLDTIVPAAELQFDQIPEIDFSLNVGGGNTYDLTFTKEDFLKLVKRLK